MLKRHILFPACADPVPDRSGSLWGGHDHRFLLSGNILLPGSL